VLQHFTQNRIDELPDATIQWLMLSIVIEIGHVKVFDAKNIRDHVHRQIVALKDIISPMNSNSDNMLMPPNRTSKKMNDFDIA
jgi:hypothetical protein